MGLPAGQVGNSEVGHLTIGGGRTVPQAALTIDRVIAGDGLRSRSALAGVFAGARARDTAVHVIGIASAGGAHGHIHHIGAVLDLAREYGHADRTFVHAVSDGRDVPARSARHDLRALEEKGANLATICGRAFAMDRSGRWDRTDLVVRALTETAAAPVRDWDRLVGERYASGVTDEHLEPIVLPAPRIMPGDEVVMTNFRPDGLRQLATRLGERHLPLTTMTRYGEEISARVVFDSEPVKGTLAQAVSAAGLTQVHVAEREKFGHVTYLLNGYSQEPQPGERHIAIDSRTDVPGYDRAPEMSAREITDVLCREIAAGEAGFMVANLANLDSVGHTGSYDAVRTAAEVVDACLATLADATRKHGVRLVITADHGNGESMLEADGRTPDTRHTSNPVPLWIDGLERSLAPAGDLRDIAPTCLDLLGIEPPAAMTGRVL